MFKKFSIASLFTLIFSVQTNASLIVEQYDDFWSTDVNALIDYANNNAASASGYFDIIDFTDDPNGFAGTIPGSNLWPSAAAAGITGATGANEEINNTFFARITGDFYASVADTYYFQTYNDDGVFVYIDDVLVINDRTLHPEQRYEGSANLSVGMHSVELYFFENSGEASLEFTVANSSRNFAHWGAANGPVSLVEASAPASMFGLSLVLLALTRLRRNA